MPLKSLLLSKDTDVIQSLTRLLKDLDIVVEPCSEPFAAAKRLMDQHFDAILVDCEDEQGAGWVLQSARMAVGSKKCVTIAIVGPRSANRGGPKAENFVIQKPIVLKQVESTLRAARNLMGDGGGSLHSEAPAPGSAVAASPTSSTATPPPHAMPTAQGRPPAEIFDELTAAVDRLGPQAPAPRPVSAAGSVSAGAAAAAAPAWEKPAPVLPPPVAHQEVTTRPAPPSRPELSRPAGAPAKEAAALLPLAASAEMTSAVRPVAEPVPSADALDAARRRMNSAAQPAWRTDVEQAETPAPHFSGLVTEAEPGRAFPFKAIAAVMVLVSLALFGYSWYRNRNVAHPPANQTQAAATPAPAAEPTTEVPSSALPASPPASPVPQTENSVAQAAPEPVSPAPSGKRREPVTPAEEVKETAAPAENSDSGLPPAPLVVAGGQMGSTAAAAHEESPAAPPSLGEVASPSKSGLGAVVSPATVSLPRMAAAPQRVRVSQGVTEGLLVHQVTPQYPSTAREMRVEGDVVLEAVIGKDGSVRDLKAVSGPPMLRQAAINAVRQWRYKPYLLNGQPVEVETQIKLQFRL